MKIMTIIITPPKSYIFAHLAKNLLMQILLDHCFPMLKRLCGKKLVMEVMLIVINNQISNQGNSFHLILGVTGSERAEGERGREVM